MEEGGKLTGAVESDEALFKLVAKWNGTKYDLELPGSGTVGQVRSWLQEQTRVSQKRQKLIGLGKKPNPDDKCVETLLQHGLLSDVTLNVDLSRVSGSGKLGISVPGGSINVIIISIISHWWWVSSKVRKALRADRDRQTPCTDRNEERTIVRSMSEVCLRSL